jgi:hypothetical protein
VLAQDMVLTVAVAVAPHYAWIKETMAKLGGI